MHSRVYSNRKPVKRVRLLPADRLSKYPASLRPSFLLVWCWKILLIAETISLALATWLRRRIQGGRQVINDRLQRLAIRKRTRRYGVVLIGWLSWPFRTVWRGLVIFGHSGPRMSRSRTHAIDSWLHSRRMSAQQSSWNHPVSRFEAYSTEPSSLRLSSPREQDLRRELTEAHARLVEELLAAEAELTRVATRIVRLQSLIRSRKHLLAEMGHLDENPAESSQVPAKAADNLVGIVKSSSRGALRNMPLFRRKEKVSA